MKTAYCNQCRRAAIMARTLTLMPVVDDAGSLKKTTIATYHCSSCGAFADSGEPEPEKPKPQVGFFAKERRATYESAIKLHRA